MDLEPSRSRGPPSPPRTRTVAQKVPPPPLPVLLFRTLLNASFSARPYRTFLATPIVFASTALFLIVLSCFTKPWESLAAFVFCIAGAVPYRFQHRRDLRGTSFSSSWGRQFREERVLMLFLGPVFLEESGAVEMT